MAYARVTKDWKGSKEQCGGRNKGYCEELRRDCQMNYLLELPDEASRERFRGMWHQSLVMEYILPGLVGKTFMCSY